MLGDWGRLPSRTERAAIAAGVARYHRAVAADDDARICAQMSREAVRAFDESGAGSCAKQIGALYSGYFPAMRRALLRAKITELRVKGNHAIAIGFIHGPRTIKVPMVRERGTWRYGTFGKWTPRSL